MRYFNIIIFLILLTTYITFSSHIKFSTNFLELFFSKETVKFFDIAKKLELSNTILISKKGFDDINLDELFEISNKLEQLSEISKVSISLLPSEQLKEYYKQNYYILADFNSTKSTKQEIKYTLQKRYDELQNSFFYTPLDTNDPLELFGLNFSAQKRYLELKDYGYVLKAKTDIDTSSASDAKKLYDELHEILKEHKDTLVYAPFFFLVENSTYIRSDTEFIVTLCTVLLFILYFFMLKDIKLLANTVIAIASSVLSAVLITSLFLDDINILILAFGISITTVSIDYMFHYYFHNDFSKEGFIKQKRVFFGFLSTFGVFVIFCFIDIKLFAHLAFFSMVSLLSAYLIFSWTFGYIRLKEPNISDAKKEIKSFNPLYIIAISAILFIYAYNHLEFDNNLRNLDYQNEKLKGLSKKFNEGMATSDYKGVLINAHSKEELLQTYEKLASEHKDILGIGRFILSQKRCSQKLEAIKNYDFERVKKIINDEAKEIGFNDAFKNSYANIQSIKCDMQTVEDMEFKSINYENKFYTLALVKKDENIKESENIKVLDLKEQIDADMKSYKRSISKYMFISIVFIIFILFILSKKSILYPLTFIFFPLSVTLFFISLFGKINLMHLFALIILIAISIDYGVYMNKTKTLIQTKTAIKYALLSTLAGFGMLILSDTAALHSIGFVITIGIAAISFLMAI